MIKFYINGYLLSIDRLEFLACQPTHNPGEGGGGTPIYRLLTPAGVRSGRSNSFFDSLTYLYCSKFSVQTVSEVTFAGWQSGGFTQKKN